MGSFSWADLIHDVRYHFGVHPLTCSWESPLRLDELTQAGDNLLQLCSCCHSVQCCVRSDRQPFEWCHICEKPYLQKLAGLLV